MVPHHGKQPTFSWSALRLGVVLLLAAFELMNTMRAYGAQLKEELSAICTIVARAPNGETSSGTAFFISDQGHLLTNGHVVPVDTVELQARCEGGVEWVSKRDVVRAPDEDLAILSTGLHNTPYLRLAYGPPADTVGASVRVLGSPFGLEQSVTPGLVSRLASISDKVALQLSMAVNPGNSGSPVIGPDGEVIGVITSQLQNAQGISFAVPAFLLWHYDEFSSGMRPRQKRFDFDYMKADLRRAYLVTNLSGDVAPRIRKVLDYCLDNKGMAPVEGEDVCQTIRERVRINERFLILSNTENFGMTGTKIVLRDKPEVIFTAWSRRFAGDNLQVVMWSTADSPDTEAMRTFVTQWRRDPLAWF